MSVERLFDVALGLSILGWGAAALLHDPSFSFVRLTIAVLNFAVGALLIFRRAPERSAAPSQIAMALPAVAISGVALYLAPPPERWPTASVAVLGVGCLIALIAFAFLGRSFAVLPSLRRVVARGPYALIRHPAYAGELIMLGGAASAAGALVAGILIPAALLLTALRVRAEERLLLESDAYREYAARVRWRMFPFVW